MKWLITIILLFSAPTAFGQFLLQGTVYDKGKINYVEGVRVVSSSGIFAITDSMGRYAIYVNDYDSVFFQYSGKPTRKFSVNEVNDPRHFDISILAKVESKYKVLKEVIVYSKSFREDSIENRETYADIFNYEKPGLKTVSNPGGPAGFDVNELINMFRFNRNKRLQSFQKRLIKEEQEKYVDMKFNKVFVSRITGLSGAHLDSFCVRYRPDYVFCKFSNEIHFNQYVLNCSYQYRRLFNLPLYRRRG